MTAAAATPEGRLCSVTAKKGTTTDVFADGLQPPRRAWGGCWRAPRPPRVRPTPWPTPTTVRGTSSAQRYPSERVVDYVYDGAGRIAGAKTGADGWYAGGTGDNAVGYEAHGGVKQLLLGNGLWEQRRYNARLQPTQIGLGTTKATGSRDGNLGRRPTAGLLLLDYSYGASLEQRQRPEPAHPRAGTSLNQNQVYTYDSAEPAEDGRGDRQRHRLVADLYLRPLRQPPGNRRSLPRIEPGADAPVDRRYRRRHQPAGRGSREST